MEGALREEVVKAEGTRARGASSEVTSYEAGARASITEAASGAPRGYIAQATNTGAAANANPLTKTGNPAAGHANSGAQGAAPATANANPGCATGKLAPRRQPQPRLQPRRCREGALGEGARCRLPCR